MSFITVALVRHGETEFNRQDLVQGTSDIRLNDLGIQQARLLGAHVANEKFTRAYSSDLKRAEETCKIILEHSQTPAPQITLESNLREKCFGVYEGQPNKELHNAAKERNTHLFHFHAPGGESHDDSIGRATTFLEKLCKISDEAESDSQENVLVVSHGMLIVTLLIHLESKKDEYIVENFQPAQITGKPFPNTGRTILRIHKLENSEDAGIRRIEVVSFGDGSHLV